MHAVVGVLCCLFAHKLAYFQWMQQSISLNKQQGQNANSATSPLNWNANKNKMQSKTFDYKRTYCTKVPEHIVRKEKEIMMYEKSLFKHFHLFLKYSGEKFWSFS